MPSLSASVPFSQDAKALPDSTSVLDSWSPIGAPEGAPSGMPTVTVRPAKSSPTALLDSLIPLETSAPVRPQSSWTGMGGQLWHGVKEGVMGLANTATSEPRAIADLGLGAYNWLTGKNVQNPMPSYQAAPGPEPQGFGERAARAIGQGLPMLPLLGAGAAAEAPTLLSAGAAGLRSMGANAAPVIGGQVGGEMAEEAAPESLKPLAQFAGSVAAGGVAGGVQQLGAKGALAARQQAGVMGAGRKSSIGGMPVTAAQADLAAGQVAGALGPEGRAILQADPGPWGMNDQIVPGSQPTTAQLAPTPGAVGLEQAHRVASPAPFIQRAQEQNAARVGAIEGQAPAGSQTSAAVQFFANRLNDIDQQGQTGTTAARTGIEAQTGGLGGQQPTAAIGDQTRGALQAAKEPVHAQTRRLWQAVDPDGTWALPATATREAGAKLQGEVSPTAQMDAQEGKLLDRAATLPDVVKFSELGQMRADINAAMRRLSGTPGFDPNIRRLTILKQSIDQAISEGMENLAATEAQAVSSGAMPPERTMEARLQAEANGTGVNTAAREATAGGVLGAGNGANGGVAPTILPGVSGAKIPPLSGPRGAAGDQGVSGQTSPSLLDFLTRRGGVKPDADLLALDADKYHQQQGGRLLNKRGDSLDYAREAAVEAGYLKQGADINDLRQAIGDELAGRKVYPHAGAAEVGARQQSARDAAHQQQAYERAQHDVLMAEQDAGARLTSAEIEHAIQLRMGGAHPQQAIEEAARSGEEATFQRNAQADAFSRPGIPAGARQAEMPVSAPQPQLEPNFQPEHAAGYRAAVAATQAEKQRFGQGGVGQVLRPGRQGEDFAVQSGAVPAKIFTRGPTEPTEVARFITAVGGPEKAATIGRETLANELRQAGIIKADGTLDAARFARWQEKRAPTLEQFPGLSDQFRNAETAQRTLDQATAAHLRAVDEFEKSAAGHFITDDPMVAVRRAFSSPNPTETFGKLARMVRGHPDAEGGLRRAVVDFIQERLTGTAPAGTSELDFLKAATYRTWLDRNASPLKALFGGQGFQNLNAVGQDLRRVSQGTTATVGPDTAQKLLGVKKAGLGPKVGHASALGVLMLAGEHLGSMVHGGLVAPLVGAVGVPAVGELISSLRHAGLNTANDLVQLAMLNPSVARELMQRMRPDGTIGPIAQRRIANAVRAATATQATQTRPQ